MDFVPTVKRSNMQEHVIADIADEFNDLIGAISEVSGSDRKTFLEESASDKAIIQSMEGVEVVRSDGSYEYFQPHRYWDIVQALESRGSDVDEEGYVSLAYKKIV